MADIAKLVDELGGMAQKRQLVRRGATDWDLTRAYQSRQVIRARNGWYSTMPADSPPVRAVRVGGRLTGISALIEWGAWVEKPHPLHVSVKENAARLRTQQNRRVRFNPEQPAGVIVHWDDSDITQPGTAVSVGLSDALYRVIVDEELEVAVACLDWAIHSRRLDYADFVALVARLPEAYRYIAGWIDFACESLPESLVRTRARLRGHRVTSQIRIVTNERIDLAVDDIAGIEVDGEATHVNTFEKDRAKDVEATIAGFHALRPSARMVFNSFDRFYLALVTALAARSTPPVFDPTEIQAIARAGEAKASEFRHPPTRLQRKSLNFRSRRGRGGNTSSTRELD